MQGFRDQVALFPAIGEPKTKPDFFILHHAENELVAAFGVELGVEASP